ncbi:hypothetical protein HS088_TW11G00103 [Tripterygium wilfordii]|uniref:ATP-dependent Clp protease proteolytic subunit n=1 Tax=Tripterygium wilfordii TaxID=458696 RepID=A0A7J7D145_TRIWF|nr:hypothetical protein HS088_TW11G00103 [Tripterygium wilfordii]
MPPYLDIYDSPLMATPAQVERTVNYNEHRPTTPPPDLPSLLLHGRIVYIGMPLVPAVTELIVAELMYLQWADPKAPIYMYINSTGTTRDDNETAIINRDTLVKLLAKHTGNSEETVANAMRRPYYMDATKAKEFGVIDKVSTLVLVFV